MPRQRSDRSTLSTRGEATFTVQTRAKLVQFFRCDSSPSGAEKDSFSGSGTTALMDRPSDHPSLRKLQRCLVSPWVWHHVFHPTTRYVVAWLMALVTMSAVFYSAWHAFDQPGRNDCRPSSDPLPDIKPDRLYAGALPV